jgi:cellulose synthase/poly-beta-1,6-N-acetylglucosamine synthase-like glycosyltransferase
MNAMQNQMKVVIAVLTYRRPADLAELIPLLVDQALFSDDDVEILVVDNDPDGGAKGTLASYADNFVRYVHEPKPGIAAGRNRALDEAADADVLVFIDDDERPRDDWLQRLLEMYRRTQPAAVVGPVLSSYEHELDGWIRDGRFFERRRHASGAEVTVAATNNLLLDLHQIRQFGTRFDEEFGLTGGSDTLFTRHIVRAGGRLVWCDEAPVVDVVPASRLTREWVMKRAFRSANSWSRTSLALAPTPSSLLVTRLKLTASGLIRIVAGSAQALFGIVVGSRAHDARGRRTLTRGAGMVAGAWGHVYAEYAR